LVWGRTIIGDTWQRRLYKRHTAASFDSPAALHQFDPVLPQTTPKLIRLRTGAPVFSLAKPSLI
jgi:hypothetical protein